MVIRFSWPVTLTSIALLGYPISTAIRDLLAQQRSAQADARQAQASFDAALQLRRQAVQVNPVDASMQLALAKNAQSLWQFRGTIELKIEADNAFDRAKILSPHWPLPHYDHARMYALSGKYDRALALLGPALKLDANNAGYWLEKARYLEALNRSVAARESYQRCQLLAEISECQQGWMRLDNTK